jgi:hypothetical protein
MTDLTSIIVTDGIQAALDAYYESNDEQRKRLGLSEIGHPCHRYLWYRHHGYPTDPVKGSTLRLFKLGLIIEDHIVSDLRDAGYVVSDSQAGVALAFNGITLYGHADGIIEGLPESSQKHLLEIKTASKKNFDQLKKKASYQDWNPKYKGQIQAYMLGLALKRALVVVYCKDTSEIYSERIRYDHQYALDLLSDVFTAIQATEPPERKCPKADYFEAKWCSFYKECFNQ